MNLYFLTYNNYYNRIVKRESNLQGYLPYVIGSPVTGVNFVPNDYVNTEQIINWTLQEPDYMIAVKDDGSIDSRWYVIDHIRTRAQQLKLTLRRDLMVDYYDEVIDSDVFIEKATLTQSDPLIYNTEDMTFNQIKKSETVLKDESGCPWIVFYGDQKTRMNSTIDVKEGSIAAVYSSQNAFYSSPIYQAYNARNHFIGSPSTINYSRWRFYYYYSGSGYYIAPFFEFADNKINRAGVVSFNSGANYIKTTVNRNGQGSGEQDSQFNLNLLSQTVQAAIPALQAGPAGLLSDIKNAGYWVNESTYNDAVAMANQVVKVMQSDGSAKYYKIICTPTTSSGQIYANVSDQNILNLIKQKGYQLGIFESPSNQPTTPFNNLYMTVSGYTVDIQETSVNNLTVDITATNYTKDVPYNVYCMPYSDSLEIVNTRAIGFHTVTANKSISMHTISALIRDYAGAGALYDAQILPYCPLVGTIVSNNGNRININTSDASVWTPIQDSAGKVEGYVFRVEFSSFNRTITLANPITITDRKVSSQVDLYRLCSPNFNGIFEFSAAKNEGINNFAVSCTYKPFTPYIKIRPDFKGLYGADFNDSRGLILGGDFSLPVITDAWKTYELQNKNYQNSFDRQINSMEIQNNIIRQQEKWQLVTGAAQAVTSGAMSGAMMGSVGGGAGAAIGGAIGGVASGAISVIGGLKDIEFNEELRKEAMSLTKDQYGYQLGNIRALPQSLSKTSAYNIDNKYFPFLEYYSCTDVEKMALLLKIRHNGMTCGIIGKPSGYINNSWSYTLDGTTVRDRGYFKGKLIKLPESAGIESHIANSIATELFQGVYYKWE